MKNRARALFICFPYIYSPEAWHVCVKQLIQLVFLSALGGKETASIKIAFRYIFNFTVLDVRMLSPSLPATFDLPVPIPVIPLVVPKSLLVSF